MAGFGGSAPWFGPSRHTDTGVMDLGQFEPFASDEDVGDRTNGAPIWRLPPEESYSDWTIEIRWLVEAEADQDNNGTSTTTHPQKDIAGGGRGGGGATGGDQHDQTSRSCHYHVHKALLGTGPRSSLYFAKVFRSQFFSESSAQKSIITLPKVAAESFPLLLDYVYDSRASKVQVDSPAVATAVRFLANYFGMKELFDNVNSTFISRNISQDTVFDYLHEAIRYDDHSLRKAAVAIVSRTISGIGINNNHNCLATQNWNARLTELPLATFLEIVEQVKFANEPDTSFGIFLLKYIDQHAECDGVDGGRGVLTSAQVAMMLQNLSSACVRLVPYKILDVFERYDISATHPVRTACDNAIAESWYDRPYLWGSSSTSSSMPLKFSVFGGTMVTPAEEAAFAAMSDAKKIHVLQAALKCASMDRNHQLGQEQQRQEQLLQEQLRQNRRRSRKI
jgi:hypothetical protein